MTIQIFDYLFHYGYEKGLLFQNEDVGLRAMLSQHDTEMQQLDDEGK